MRDVVVLKVLSILPTIAARGREATQVPPNAPDVGAPKRNLLYVIQANKEANTDEGTGKL